jgi:hypothetical protein
MGCYGRGWEMKRQWARGGAEEKGRNRLQDEANVIGVVVSYSSKETTKLKSCYLLQLSPPFYLSVSTESSGLNFNNSMLKQAISAISMFHPSIVTSCRRYPRSVDSMVLQCRCRPHCRLLITVHR